MGWRLFQRQASVLFFSLLFGKYVSNDSGSVSQSSHQRPLQAPPADPSHPFSHFLIPRFPSPRPTSASYPAADGPGGAQQARAKAASASGRARRANMGKRGRRAETRQGSKERRNLQPNEENGKRQTKHNENVESLA